MARLACCGGGSIACLSSKVSFTGVSPGGAVGDLSCSLPASSSSLPSLRLWGCPAWSRGPVLRGSVWLVENVSGVLSMLRRGCDSRVLSGAGPRGDSHTCQVGRTIWSGGLHVRPLLALRQRPVVATVAVVETGTSSSGGLETSSLSEDGRLSLDLVRTEEELLYAVHFEAERRHLPSRAVSAITRFWSSYRTAVESSGREGAIEVAVLVMAQVIGRIVMQFENPFRFQSHHLSVREPYDYYHFGQEYLRPLVDFNNSYLGNLKVFDEIESYVKQGHNVVLLSNHQTEADPGLMALLLERSHPFLAESLTYVAGDRVVQDPFCKPFSMGRNLLCVYSKKHIHDDPNTATMKTSANRQTLKVMTSLFFQGGQLLWIAPSGGRDRPNVSGQWTPAEFDASSVETMRRLVYQEPGQVFKGKMKPPGHMYPLALHCYSVMPPPSQVEKELGEERVIGYSGIGMSVGRELNLGDIMKSAADMPDRIVGRELLSKAAWEAMVGEYKVLTDALLAGKGCTASTPTTILEQPFSTASRNAERGEAPVEDLTSSKV